MTTFICESNNIYFFDESNELPRGRSGSFGVIRFGQRVCDNRPQGEAVVIKEFVQSDSKEPLSFVPRYTRFFLDSCTIVESASRCLPSLNDRMEPEHVFTLRSRIGQTVYAYKNSSTGTLEPLNLQHHIDLFGLNDRAANNSKLERPAEWAEFLLQRRNMRNEIEMMSLIPRHPNLIQMLDHGELVDGNRLRIFLVLPFYQNGDAMDAISDNHDFNFSMHIFLGTLSGLEALHEAGLCHRDLKLDNILIADDGVTPVIADFGLASTTANNRLNHNKVGSPNIRAPEIFVRGSELTGRPGSTKLNRGYEGKKADMWSMGIVLFNAVTRNDFFLYPPSSRKYVQMTTAESSDPGFRLLQLGTGRLPDKIPPGVSNLILRLLVADPDARPTVQEARDMGEECIVPTVNDEIADALSRM